MPGNDDSVRRLEIHLEVAPFGNRTVARLDERGDDHGGGAVSFASEDHPAADRDGHASQDGDERHDDEQLRQRKAGLMTASGMRSGVLFPHAAARRKGRAGCNRSVFQRP
jgi:hypothetical protein